MGSIVMEHAVWLLRIHGVDRAALLVSMVSLVEDTCRGDIYEFMVSTRLG